MEKDQLRTMKFIKGFDMSNIEDFQKDFSVFLETPLEVIDAINNTFKNKEDLSKDTALTVGKISIELGYSAVKLSKLFSVVSFLTRLIDGEETIEDALHDLFYERYIEEEQYKKALDLCKKLTNLFALSKEVRKERVIKSSGTPVFYYCAYSSNMRFQGEKLYNINYDINSYSPKLKKLIPIGCIEIALKKLSGEESFSFQISENDLEDFIKTLQALNKELNLLKKLSEKYET